MADCAVFVVVHNSRAPVQHTCRAGTPPLQAGCRFNHKPPIPSAKAWQAHHLHTEPWAGQVGNWTNWDPNETSAWYEHNCLII